MILQDMSLKKKRLNKVRGKLGTRNMGMERKVSGPQWNKSFSVEVEKGWPG